ncbi:MAG: reductive dehalogenase domain-containing protein, partial [Candidatus Thorarchaeota archaeon]
MDPTTEVDWAMTQRFDRNLRKRGSGIYGDEVYSAKRAAGSALAEERTKRSEPGFTLKDEVVGDSFDNMRTTLRLGGKTWVGPTETRWVDTPEERGVPKWTGTPEEASRMLQAFSRHVGAAWVGYAELDSTWRNKIITKATSRGEHVYEDVDQGYEVSREKRVIPNKPMYIFVSVVPDSFGTSKYRPSAFPATNRMAIALHCMRYYSVFNFLRGLGYQQLGDGGHQQDPTTVGQSGALTGMGELSRQSYYLLSPEYGPLTDAESQLTDLPLA